MRTRVFQISFVVLGVMSIVAFAANVWALTPPTPRVVVDVKAGQIQKKPAIPQEDVRVSYEGVFHPQPITIKPVADAHNRSVDSLIAQMIAANSKGDPVAMASIFIAAERAGVMDTYQDPKLLKPNMQFFRQVTEAALNGYVVDGKVIYLLATFKGHEIRPLVVPVVRTEQGYFLTNKLANPSTMAELSAAHMHGQISNFDPK